MHTLIQLNVNVQGAAGECPSCQTAATNSARKEKKIGVKTQMVKELLGKLECALFVRAYLCGCACLCHHALQANIHVPASR